MMQTFDWIVVGNGLVGAAASYELARQGLSVLLVDQRLDPDSATRYSYGGIPYWSGTSALTRTLCQEGIAKHRQLSEELGANTQFRELDLLLTVAPEDDPQVLAAHYAQFAVPPQFISRAEAQEREPLLTGPAVAGAFTVRHGHVSPVAVVAAYNQAFHRLGGTRLIAQVTGLVRVQDRVTGLLTTEQAYPAHRVLVASGAFSRQLLATAGLKVPLYYTQAEVIETLPTPEITLRALVMPAVTQRLDLEAQASRPEVDNLWDEPGHEVTPSIIDGGAIQFQDHHFCLGQISRTLTDLDGPADTSASIQNLRHTLAGILPSLSTLPGHWHRCPVSFSRDGLPLVGSLPGLEGLEVMAGFNGPFVYLPPIAQRFAQAATGQPDQLLNALRPDRFLTEPSREEPSLG
ncbi:FAD-dependent oxidoreductase [Leptolyngbya sp. BL0902]|uniref:NAD(P)/FAD-dependent oxidoreductase n=1 Tax=Leptolyngbya sp. BL0902 TaxID=1115757 RepID=UPI001934CFF1|nr:FAD-binding oxidoreductase [Leptolyngbya sp. BL0902]QQE63667.1 FAD-dependent oxidoreductase [Leptolyngbya sp. BL0902]